MLVVGVSQIDITNDELGGDDSASSGDVATLEAPESRGSERDAGGGAGGEDAAVAEALSNKAAPGDLLRDERVGFTAAQRNSAALGQEIRRVERDVQMTLAAPVDEVQDVTNEAIDVVESHRGIVESSNSSVTDERAQATLQLVVPTRQLDATMEQLSDLADVKSMSEGTQDITRSFVDAHDQLAGFRAERKSLLAQIEAADTQDELDTLKLRLQATNEAIARAETEFEAIQKRANLSDLTLSITSKGADSSDDWSFDDALDDAGKVLTVAAGVILISAAVLLPLAVIAAIAYFVLSASKRRARERALDE